MNYDDDGNDLLWFAAVKAADANVDQWKKHAKFLQKRVYGEQARSEALISILKEAKRLFNNGKHNELQSFLNENEDGEAGYHTVYDKVFDETAHEFGIENPEEMRGD